MRRAKFDIHLDKLHMRMEMVEEVFAATINYWFARIERNIEY